MAFFDLVRKLRGAAPQRRARHSHRPPDYPQSVEDLPPWAREMVEDRSGAHRMSDEEVAALIERRLEEDPALRADLEEAIAWEAERRRQRHRQLGLD